ncbi:SAM-dependent methyltransferase [Echinicola marina]|uniref:TPMT family class I SAM-dependent methyltransferase n=1 Tax=Echinicola marina TaxID=2859768 RepID=UPI001CF6D2ED|nr:TPMT family class I SAM-dependent methyltransferase [Echinicola marina]UCS91481.1 SAM-dependent methyltransferase [Echinicola marina]
MTISELFDENYWTSRYHLNQTGWDVGEATNPLKQYLDQIANKEIKILIPGAGNAYEAAYAYNIGFKNVNILDISLLPLDKFAANHPDFPSGQLLHENFFEHKGEYDLIIEQTFFCALNPSLRKDYVKKMTQLLKPTGELGGVLFDVDFGKPGPPFGGNKVEYLKCFEPELKVVKMERCYNSIRERAGIELFFKAVKA